MRMVVDAATMLTHQQPQALVLATCLVPQKQAKAPPVPQPVTQPETTGPDVVVNEEEIIEIGDNDGNKQDQVAEDQESTILSMIQVYKESDTPPQVSDTPCQICATLGKASVGEQSTDTEIMNTAVSLSLLYLTLAEMELSLEMSQ